ncbi:S-layer homology domain-containing protein [Saccharibacillus kuerlensis]|uniref:SLH domain-containing protein n=1 Tax=Saccharibacillus kuerlensis TaxID=459527 RepID=A0ABQ2KZN9_9BACL|nr:S-layer homology domain-containing protein [Saccharibacillus kuerlensis]GGN98054.1 hypothetical protein GCM10010969_16640 [Saccharibacillus kuerlensis]
MKLFNSKKSIRTSLAAAVLVAGLTPAWGGSSVQAAENSDGISSVLNSDQAETIPPGATAFTDVEGNENQEEIEAAFEAGLIKGYSDGTFRPSASLTRAEFVTLLGRALDVEGDPSQHPYNDKVPMWAAPYVAGLEQRNLLGSFADDEMFHPNQEVTNQEAVELIALAADVNVWIVGTPGTASDPITRGELTALMVEHLLR